MKPGRRLNILWKMPVFTILFVMMGFTVASGQDTNLRQIENEAFQYGEFLKYRVFYDSWMTSWITAGHGTMIIGDRPVMINGRSTYQIDVIGKSIAPFSMFYRVRDKFTTFLDDQAIIPWKYIRRTNEGSYVVEDDVYFDHINGFAKTTKSKLPIPKYVQDLVSVFYYVRTMNFDSANVNDVFHANFYLDDSIYISRIVFLGKEKVETTLGVFNCLKFKPQVVMGEIFQEPYPMELWVTDDKNKIPILIKSAVYIGSVKAELIKYDNLKYPLGEK